MQVEQGAVESGTETTTNGVSDSLAAQRAATLAALEAGEHLGEDAEPEKPAAKKPAEKVEQTEVADEKESDKDVDEDEDLDEDDDEEDLDDDADDEEDGAQVAKDPEVAKKIAQVQKAERRAKEMLARERATFDREREAFVAEWKPKVEAAEKFAQLKNKARYDLVSVLQELGLSEDDFEDGARELYAYSKKGAADPANKAAVARARKERELADEIRELKKWRDEREATDQKRLAEEEQIRQGKAIVGKIAKAVSDEQPLLKHLLATNVDRGEEILAAAAGQLWDELGSQPSRKRVLKRAERLYRTELKRLGIDPAVVAKADPAKKSTKTAEKKAESTTEKTAASTDGAVAKSPKEQRADVLRLLQEGKYD
jgi:hypothetical protein